MGNYASKVIEIALAEVGYLEKRSNSQLDSKTANAGSANYTKYGRDMHKLYPSVMDFPAAWCDAFVDWCFQKAYGVSNAKGLLGGKFDDYTPNSAQLYKNKGAWYKTPKKGDQVFFTNGSRICHTGLVYKVDSAKVYTVEGNTSGASGVIANGGGVCKKSYALNYSRIAGYGRPKYDAEPGKTETKTETVASPVNENVKKGQKWLNDNYGHTLESYRGEKLEEDGKCGTKTRAGCVCVWKDVVNRKYGFGLTPSNSNFYESCKKAAKKATLVKGASGTLTLIAQLILSAKGFYTGKMDADFGSGTEKAVNAFKKTKELPQNGKVDAATWYALFN